ncbi:MAG: cryptochrome/photolyase family protein [Gammaproteobacteria bacterium]|nr:cryptochrome/photolyase family protein [Gammaproteobacteria bacterium]
MSTLHLILGDQLSRSITALQDIDPERDVMLMAELADEALYVPHHKQKLVLIFSAMRHFAADLESQKIEVDYVSLEDKGNSDSFTGEVERALQRHGCERIVVTEPGEWRVMEMMQSWEERLEVPVDIRPDDRFLCSLSEFSEWAEGRKALRMEFFYREMRRKTGWLMDDRDPQGGRWNYDSENRKALPKKLSLPRRDRFEPNKTTREVMDMVQNRFSDHFGELDEFGWAVTREDALEALDHFITVCLPKFGDYQDAMKSGEDFLFHSLISPYLNIGLLLPREVCEAALASLGDEHAPLAAVEGFLRQILGWREFMRGLYWLLMPDYADSNFLEAKRPLPDFYWTGKTDMNCLSEAIGNTRRNAYAHHIQRLMVTGNFALLTGIDPAKVEEWYLLVYIDAFEWVELPNTHGMALFADGGVLASKPYAASGAYINRMSNHCGDCRFNPKEKLGDSACPFNYLYWNFLLENEQRLRSNPRMGLAYRNLDRMSSEQSDAIREQAVGFLDAMASE